MYISGDLDNLGIRDLVVRTYIKRTVPEGEGWRLVKGNLLQAMNVGPFVYVCYERNIYSPCAPSVLPTATSLPYSRLHY